MSKKRFIQSIIIRRLPELDAVDATIHYAEALWDLLTQKGYGANAENAPREQKDWYNALDGRQRKWFTGFWNAFNYKKDRNGAAMRWHQLGECDDATYQFIIDAAAKEAQKHVPHGQSRKMAQGWLHEQRYNDYQPTAPDQRNQKNHILTRLNNELNAIRKLHEANPDPALAQQIEQLQERINDARAQS